MKSFLFALSLTLGLSAFAADMEYPVQNYKYISEWDYRDEVEVKDKFVVLVFSSKDCLERAIIDRSCWLFEKKFDYFVKKFSPVVKVVGLNTYFENYRVTSQFMIKKNPTIIIMRNGQQLHRFEPKHNAVNIQNGPWEDQLLQETLNVISKFH